MVRLALLKLSIVGGFAIAVVGTVESLGIPASWQLLFNGIVIGWALHSVLSSYVGGLVPPNEESSRAYIHYFMSCHLFFQRSNAYFTPWKLLGKLGKEAGE
jgi:hypothetical protein